MSNHYNILSKPSWEFWTTLGKDKALAHPDLKWVRLSEECPAKRTPWHHKAGLCVHYWGAYGQELPSLWAVLITPGAKSDVPSWWNKTGYQVDAEA